MDSAVLHYIYDPLCGWCYGASPLVQAARQVIPVIAHGGGMMADERRQMMTPSLRSYVIGHDARIAQTTGVTFGAAYQEQLLADPTTVLDSTPPTAAILAAEQLGGRGLDFLARVQKAHYVEGQRVADRRVLLALAESMGFAPSAFGAAMDQVPVQAHMEESRALLAQNAGRGFPTFLLERGGRFARLDLGPYWGRPDAWKARLQQDTDPRTC